MKRYKIIIIVVLVFAVGLVSWSLYSKKSLDHIKQHATLVRAMQQEKQRMEGRLAYE